MDDAAALEQQKQQCIFCKIVKGDVPAKKVYEDDVMLAIMDINPAAKGHVLLLPKEHYPILPLVPFEHMQHLFEKTRAIAKALKEAMLCQGVTVFIANGAAAGQQSPHFLYHLIPREHNDALTCFDLPATGDKEANGALEQALRRRVGAFMNAYLPQTERDDLRLEPAPEERPRRQEQVSGDQLDKLITLINENDDLKDALINRADEVKEAVRTNKKWQALFKGVDVDKLSQNLQVMAAAQAKKQDPNPDTNEEQQE
ncbi:HIT domain-containing protein [Candidatus Woesearchaeota archaeon]|nr:HIT domain-containing protein [Candidatus Woesearchaeota archaeon]